MSKIVVNLLQKEKKRLEAKIKILESELEKRDSAFLRKIELLKELDSLTNTNKTWVQGTRETVLSKIAEINKLNLLLKKDYMKMLENIDNIQIQLDNVNAQLKRLWWRRDLVKSLGYKIWLCGLSTCAYASRKIVLDYARALFSSCFVEFKTSKYDIFDAEK